MRTHHHPLVASGAGSPRAITALHFGPEQGRRALLQCSLHADEIPPLLVGQHLRQRLSELEAAGRLRGEVVLLPACNPIGLNQQVWGRLQGRFDIASGQNFNRHYPDLAAGAAARLRAPFGDDPAANTRRLREALQAELASRPAGSALQQLRQGLMRLALDADLVLDLHCDNEALMHVYATPAQQAQAALLGRCLQSPLLLLAEESGDAPFDEAISTTWPKLHALLGGQFPVDPGTGFAATVELRGETDVSHALAAQDADGLLRFLALQGFIDGEVSTPTGDCVARPLAGCMPLVAPHAGVLVWLQPLGHQARAGEVLAELIDPLSGQVTPLRSAVDGLLFARELQRWAQGGQSVAKVAGREALRQGKLLSA